jgi:hypothetical protein
LAKRRHAVLARQLQASARSEEMMKRLLLALALSGCASTLPAVNAKVATGHEAQLCLADGAPRAGQSLRVQRDVCRQDAHAPGRLVCAREQIGSGEVVRALDSRCAVVRIAANVTIGRGDIIEVPATISTTAVASRMP